MKIIRSIINFVIKKFNFLQWFGLCILLLYIIFLSRDSFIDNIGYTHTILKLEKEVSELKKTKYNDSIKLERLNINKNEIERFGREKYLMKKDNEDLYIIYD